MKKIIFLFLGTLLFGYEQCYLYYIENYDAKNDIYFQGTLNKGKTKIVNCNNPIIEKIKKYQLYVEKRGNKINSLNNSLSNTIYYRIYYKYIKRNIQKTTNIYKTNTTNKKNKTHLCRTIFVIKKSYPTYPGIFYKENFICKNKIDGYNFQKKLGCRKRTIWKNKRKYEITICPSYVEIIK
jgi:hypothetical protein